MSEQLYQEIIEHLKDKKTRSVLISTHNTPDGDAIGSSVALELALKSMGKRVTLVLQNKVHKRYAPIVGVNRIEKVMLPPDGYSYDMAFLLDCSHPNRTYEHHKDLAKFHVVMDHHVPQRYFGDIYIHEYVPAAAVLVYKLIKLLDITITRDIANALYCAFRSDTGSFSFSNTNPEIHRFTAELLEAGADTQMVSNMFTGTPLCQYNLFADVLSHSLVVDQHRHLSYAYVTQDMVGKNKATFDDASSIIEYIRDIDGVDVSLLFLENNDGIRIRARSKTLPVNILMQKFNGNGHDKAAGAIISNSSLENVIDYVIGVTNTYLDQSNM